MREVLTVKKKIHLKTLAISLLIPLLTGILSSLFTGGSADIYKSLKMPPLAPPSWLFPVVWTVLYILMGISFYLIWQENSPLKKEAVITYIIQLTLNALWPLLFFLLQAYLVAFVWLVILWGFILYMILLFKEIRTAAGWLQLPYLLWVTFAGYLNFSIWYLNRL